MLKIYRYLLLLLISLSITACFDKDIDKCKKLFNDDQKRAIAESSCKEAADNGNIEAMNIVGKLLLKDYKYKEAEEYFIQAGNKNDGDALFNLAMLYDKGGALEKDETSARFYYEKSCTSGELRACEKVNTFKQKDREEQDRKLLEEEENKKLLQKQQKDQEQLAEQQKNLLAEQKKLFEENQKIKQEIKYLQINQNSGNNSVDPKSNSDETSNVIDLQTLKFYENLAVFRQNNLYGYVNKQGDIVIPAQFDYAARFSQGRAAVRDTNKRWGFIDTSGKYVVYPEYYCLGMFSEGLAGVYQGGYLLSNGQCSGGKWGYMNTKGEWVINPVLDEAYRFSRGKAKVIYKGRTGFIDKYGYWVD